MRSLKKSDFAELVGYITDTQGKTERLGPVTITNCQADTLHAAVAEVLATQRLNSRARGDKTYHLLVAFPPGETPPLDALRAIEARICAGLGFAEHQRVSAVHYDTDPMHLHIAICKIHPTRYTLHEPFQAYRALAQICTKLEREYGLQLVNHHFRQRVAEGRAADMERHSGMESLLSWIRRECLQDIRATQSWTGLQQVLRANGLELRERGNGFVLVAGNGARVKASSIARDLSRPHLEARLGPFEASPARQAQTRIRSYEMRPVRLHVDTAELYTRYIADQNTLTGARAAAWRKAQYRRDRLINVVKRRNHFRRTAIRAMGGGRLAKKLLYAQAHKARCGQIERIRKQYRKEKQVLYDRYKRRTWADWLKQQALAGDSEALAALRARQARPALAGNTIRGDGQPCPGYGYAAAVDNITKQGTIIFRVGLSAVRDDGDRLTVSREVTAEGVQAVLRLAMERYGDRISVNGTPEFKAQIVHGAVDSQLPITFADPTLERWRLALSKQEHAHEHREDRRRADCTNVGGTGHAPAHIECPRPRIPCGCGPPCGRACGRR